MYGDDDDEGDKEHGDNLAIGKINNALCFLFYLKLALIIVAIIAFGKSGTTGPGNAIMNSERVCHFSYFLRRFARLFPEDVVASPVGRLEEGKLLFVQGSDDGGGK